MGIELTFDEMYDNLMSNASYRLDPELTTITVERSGETIDWMADRLGMPFSDEVLVGYGPLQMMHQVDGAGAGMAEPFSKTLDDAGVELMLETKATELVMNDDGSVGGVKAEKGGSEFTITAKSVVICTGGYAYNPELTARFTPELAAPSASASPAPPATASSWPATWAPPPPTPTT